ncbi:hypothetical protein ABB37_04766 [Leptomonas pyrrhocoris]|uniref:Uncharacterized protein n=1 Tax=Leptomonas pyrrhocoris TaxID=157538 RepID=A0A0N0DVM1_LEPPY|nr:hypothetical protein ABB37_04766 [Leptomonas pyrrhocoris]XP_015659003.1 hypothetical protein ABB37_04766 [Leptomonas pyrrhocoris]KPA80563.1 hypothetical protein ABB37_04766 [Leptomonas pyrrhocoris]KPA80564.1 hypothetical protein ABB37_04766 [Leptomonas pyrrhocoris]|eukprot:XP_015659002.1 hypothetical protein ABB37_04766 [Leptomonas pyrrhocoris]
MPKKKVLYFHTSRCNAVTEEDIEHVWEALDPARWGFQHARAWRRLRKAGAPTQATGLRSARHMYPLPPHPSVIEYTRSTSTGTATTIVVKPPPGIESPTDGTSASDQSTVVVQPSAAVVSAPSAPSSSSRLSVEESCPEDETLKACVGAAPRADTFSQQNLASNTAEHGNAIDNSNGNSAATIMTTSSSSSSSSTAYTRMDEVHPTNSTRPLARIRLAAYQKQFVPTFFSAGIRPTKQCLSPASSFSELRGVPPAPFFDATQQDAPPEAQLPPHADDVAIHIAQEQEEVPTAQAEAVPSASPCGGESSAVEMVEMADQTATQHVEGEQRTEAVLSTVSSIASVDDAPCISVEFGAPPPTSSLPPVAYSATQQQRPELATRSARSAVLSRVPSSKWRALSAESNPCVQQQPDPSVMTSVAEKKELVIEPHRSTVLRSAAVNVSTAPAPASPPPPVPPAILEHAVTTEEKEVSASSPSPSLTRQSLCRVPTRCRSEPRAFFNDAKPPVASPLPSALTTTPAHAPKAVSAPLSPPAPKALAPLTASLSRSSASLAAAETVTPALEGINEVPASAQKAQTCAAPPTPSQPLVTQLPRLAAFESQEATPCAGAPPPSPPRSSSPPPAIARKERTVESVKAPAPSPPPAAILSTGVAKGDAATVSLRTAETVLRCTAPALPAKAQNSRFMRLAVTERFY